MDYDILPGDSKYLDMAYYVDNLRNSDDFFQKTYESIRTPAELMKTLLSVTDTIFSGAVEKDIEGYFSVVAEIIAQGQNADQRLAMATEYIDAVTSNPADRPAIRLAVLTNMFNLIPSHSPLRYHVFLRLIKYASLVNAVYLFKSQTSEIDSWMKSWGITVEQRRSLLKTFAELLFAVESLKPDGFELYVKYLATFENESAETLGKVKDDALQLLRHAISTPSVFQMDSLLDLKAVLQLKQEKIFELFNIFVNEKIGAYLAFASANASWITSQGLNTQVMEDKMRLLTLVTLSSQQTELPFDTIAKELQVEGNKVESWVIRAISSKLIEAQIDQMKQVVVVSFATQRVFAQEQWVQLHTRLSEWKSSIVQVLGVIERAQSANGL